MSSTWFTWRSRAVESAGKAEADSPADGQALSREGSYADLSGSRQIKQGYSELRQQSEFTGDRNPAQPSKVLEAAVEDARAYEEYASDLATKAKAARQAEVEWATNDAGSTSEASNRAAIASREAEEAAAAAAAARQNVKKMAAAFEAGDSKSKSSKWRGAAAADGGPSERWPSQGGGDEASRGAAVYQRPFAKDELPAPPQVHVDIPVTSRLLEAGHVAAMPSSVGRVPLHGPSGAGLEPPFYPSVQGNGPQGYLPLKRGTAYDRVGNGMEEEVNYASTSDEDPLLAPLPPDLHTEFVHWKKLLGWGEQLASESVLDDIRLSSLDVFRGLSIAGMILTIDSGAHFPDLNYSAWEGLSFGDFMDPFFLFIVGVAVAIAFKRVPSRRQALSKIVARTAKIFIIGLFVQGGYFHGSTSLTFGVDLENLRYSGTLQRVALAFLVVALCEVAVMKRYRDGPSEGFAQLVARFMLHWGVAVILALVYLFLTYLVPVPDWSFVPTEPVNDVGMFIPYVERVMSNQTLTVPCGVSGDLSPACNAAGHIDRSLFGLDHLSRHPTYQYSKSCSTTAPYAGPLPDGAPAWCRAPFDAEGFLSTLGGILSTFAGLHFGHVLTHFRQHWVRMLHGSIFSGVMVAAGWGLQFPLRAELHKFFPSFPSWLILEYNGMPFNKQLYSFSFMVFTSGVAGLVLCLIYILTDVMNVRFYTKAFEWLGRNPLLVFVLAVCGTFEALVRGFYWGSPDQNLITTLQRVLYGVMDDLAYANLAVTTAKIFAWAAVAGALAHVGHIWQF